MQKFTTGDVVWWSDVGNKIRSGTYKDEDYYDEDYALIKEKGNYVYVPRSSLSKDEENAIIAIIGYLNHLIGDLSAQRLKYQDRLRVLHDANVHNIHEDDGA